MKQVTIRFPDEIHNEMRHLSVDAGVSQNEYINNLVQEDLEKRKAQKEKTSQ